MPAFILMCHNTGWKMEICVIFLCLMVLSVHVTDGTLCFSCQLANIEQCLSNVVNCSDSKGCFLQESIKGSDFKFSAGCKELTSCTDTTIARRADTQNKSGPAQVICSKCCHYDYCNEESLCLQAKISPLVQTGLVFDTADFYCSMNSETNITKVTWYKDGVALDFESSTRIQTKDGKLSMIMVDRMDSGQYYCKIEYRNNTFLSNTADLTIAGGPEIKSSPWATPNAGDKVTLTCNVTGATVNHTFHWSREYAQLDRDTTFNTVKTYSSSQVEFTYLGPKQSGVYVCRDVGSSKLQPYEKIGVVTNLSNFTCDTKFTACPSHDGGVLCGGTCPPSCGYDDHQTMTKDSLICRGASPSINYQGGFVAWTYVNKNSPGSEFVPKYVYI